MIITAPSTDLPICTPCAVAHGAEPQEIDHVATLSMAACSVCGEHAECVLMRDWKWMDGVEPARDEEEE